MSVVLDLLYHQDKQISYAKNVHQIVKVALAHQKNVYLVLVALFLSKLDNTCKDKCPDGLTVLEDPSTKHCEVCDDICGTC